MRSVVLKSGIFKMGTPGLLSRVKSFHSDAKGGTAVVFAASALGLIATVAAATDYAMAVRAKTNVAVAADAAALAGLSAVTLDGSLSAAAQKTTSESVALSTFNAQLPKNVTVTSVTATYTQSSPPQMSVKYQAVASTLFAGVTGSGVNVGGEAIASSSAGSQGAGSVPYTDIHFLIDISQSMAVAVDLANAKAMMADPLMKGCTYACHYPGQDTLTVARAKGYLLRIDVIKSELDAALADIQTRFGNSASSPVRVAIYSFDNNFFQVQPLTTDMTVARAALKTVDINQYHAGTSMGYAISQLNGKLGTSGDGSTQAKAKIAVVLATDGVANTFDMWPANVNKVSTTAMPPFSLVACWDQTIATTAPYNAPVGNPKSVPCLPEPIQDRYQQLQGINPSWCASIKSKGVRMLTIYAQRSAGAPSTDPNNPNTAQWTSHYMAWLNPQLPGLMQQCASAPTDSFLVSNPASIKLGVTGAITKIIGANTFARIIK